MGAEASTPKSTGPIHSVGEKVGGNMILYSQYIVGYSSILVYGQYIVGYSSILVYGQCIVGYFGILLRHFSFSHPQVMVEVNGSFRMGVVKFTGETEFAPGDWVGVALERPLGQYTTHDHLT